MIHDEQNNSSDTGTEVPMTHNKLLSKMDLSIRSEAQGLAFYHALRAVVKLHKPVIHALPDETCLACQDFYPCPTIQAIQKELS